MITDWFCHPLTQRVTGSTVTTSLLMTPLILRYHAKLEDIFLTCILISLSHESTATVLKDCSCEGPEQARPCGSLQEQREGTHPGMHFKYHVFISQFSHKKNHCPNRALADQTLFTSDIFFLYSLTYLKHFDSVVLIEDMPH